MDKYIKQLLEQFSKVILPKFGAIVIENDENGELMFNEYLNYNDGKLDELIVKESNMELQEAQNMIAKYIRDIQAQIDKGESYDIFGLGSFSKNKDGEVEFSGNLKTGESKNKGVSAGPSPTPTKKEEKEESPKKENEKKEPKKKESTSSDKSEKKENKYVAPVIPDKETSGEPEAKSNKKDEPAKKADHSSKADKAKKEANEKAEKQKAKKKADEDKAKAKAKAKKEKEEAKKAKDKAKEDKKKSKDAKPQESKKKDSKEKKKKRKVGVFGWIIIVIIFIAAGGTITAGIYYDEISDYMGWNEFTDKKEMAQNDMAPKDESDDSETDEELTNETQVVDSLENDESLEPVAEENSASNSEAESEETNNEAVKEPVKEEEPIETYTTNASSGSYHMIAGGFRDRSNAEDKVSELKSKGMDAKIIGRINGLHFVSAKSYSSLSAAKQDVNNIQSQVPGAWIYKK